MPDFENVYGRFVSADGSPLSGSVVFTPAFSFARHDDSVILPCPVVAELDGRGRVSASLLVPGGGVEPSTWGWEAQPRLKRAGASVNLEPFTFKLVKGQPVNLAGEIPAPDPVTGEYLAKGAPGVGIAGIESVGGELVIRLTDDTETRLPLPAGGGAGGVSPEALAPLQEADRALGQRVAALEAVKPVPGPAGPQGERGPAGPQGEPGPQGPAGADGASIEEAKAIFASKEELASQATRLEEIANILRIYTGEPFDLGSPAKAKIVGVLVKTPGTIAGQDVLPGEFWFFVADGTSWKPFRIFGSSVAPQPAQPKIVPLSLTAGQNDSQSSGADLTGRKLVVPMLWGAPVTRFRVHMRNINPRTGTTGTDIPVTISRLGKSAAGVLSDPVELNFSGTVTGGSDYVTQWIEHPLTAGTEYGLEFSYTGKSTDKILQCSGGSYVIPSSGAPWVRNSTPFHIWLEAETPASTKVYTFSGDSLTVGVRSSADKTGTLPVFDSWPSKLTRMQGVLPVMYAASGDTAADWLANPNSYKVTLWDSGFAKGDVLFSNMGSNDVFAGSVLNTLKARATKIVELMRTRLNAGAPVVTTAILPRTSVPASDKLEVARRELNAWLATQPSPVGAYKHIDFIEAVSSDDDNIPAEVAADGVHPNAAGYQAIADSVNRQFSASELTPPTFRG